LEIRFSERCGFGAADVGGGNLEEIIEIFQEHGMELNHAAQFIMRAKHGNYQVLSGRLVYNSDDGKKRQMHFRVFPTDEDGIYLISGHDEYTPESSPIRHYCGISVDAEKAYRWFWSKWKKG
jgi:hypothetical protein